MAVVPGESGSGRPVHRSRRAHRPSLGQGPEHSQACRPTAPKGPPALPCAVGIGHTATFQSCPSSAEIQSRDRAPGCWPFSR